MKSFYEKWKKAVCLSVVTVLLSSMLSKYAERISGNITTFLYLHLALASSL